MRRAGRVLAGWCLVVALAGGLRSSAAPPLDGPVKPGETTAPPDGHEGAALDGLRCSMSVFPESVPVGAAVRFTLRLRFDPAGADPKVNVVNTSPENWRVEFTDTATGAVFHRFPYDPGMPPAPTRPENIVTLRGGVLPTHDVTVFLLSPRGEQIPAATYRVVATYENTAGHQVEFVKQPDGSPERRPYRGPWRFWKGKITSGPLTFKVSPAVPEKLVLKTHSALEIRHGKQQTPDGKPVETIGYAWSWENPTEIRITRRPGYRLGRSYVYHVYLNDEEVRGAGGSGLAGGAWEEGRSESFLPPDIVNRVLAGERLRVAADVDLFETSVPPGHLWEPRAGDYQVFWKSRVESVEKPTAAAPRDQLRSSRPEASRFDMLRGLDWGLEVDGLRARVLRPTGSKKIGEPVPIVVLIRNEGTTGPNQKAVLGPRLLLEVYRNDWHKCVIVPVHDLNAGVSLDRGQEVAYACDLAQVVDLDVPGEYLVLGGYDSAVARKFETSWNGGRVLSRPYGPVDLRPGDGRPAGPGHPAVERRVRESDWGETVGGLRARIAAETGSHRFGEPVPATLTIENLGVPDYHDGSAQLFPHIDLWARRAGWEKHVEVKLPVENRLRIPKGELFVHRLDLSPLIDFDAPGDYSVAAGHFNGKVLDLGDWTGTVRSPFLGGIVAGGKYETPPPDPPR